MTAAALCTIFQNFEEKKKRINAVRDIGNMLGDHEQKGALQEFKYILKIIMLILLRI